MFWWFLQDTALFNLLHLGKEIRSVKSFINVTTDETV